MSPTMRDYFANQKASIKHGADQRIIQLIGSNNVLILAPVACWEIVILVHSTKENVDVYLVS